MGRRDNVDSYNNYWTRQLDIHWVYEIPSWNADVTVQMKPLVS